MILKKYRVKMKMVNEKCQGWVQNRPANGSLVITYFLAREQY